MSYTLDDRVRLYFALCGYGTVAELSSCFTKDAAVYDTNLAPVKSQHKIATFWIKIRNKWSGATWIVDSAIVQGNRVCVEWTMLGKKKNEELFAFRGCDIYHFEGTLIKEIRQYWRFDPKNLQNVGLQELKYPKLDTYLLSNISIDKKYDIGVAVLSIHQEPVNAMGLELLRQILLALDIIEADRKIRGLIVRSGLKRQIFTAGLDINELHIPSTNPKRFMQFWHVLTMVLTRLLTTPLVTVAAIKGQCPAGGCALALACDKRVVTEDLKIGLNEVALGIAVPLFWCDLMTHVIGLHSEKLLLNAKLIGAQEAKKIGMVDLIVSNDKNISNSKKQIYDTVTQVALEGPMALALKLPDNGRQVLKKRLRSGLGERWRHCWQDEANDVWKNLSNDASINALGKVLDRLSKRNKKNGKKKKKSSSKL